MDCSRRRRNSAETRWSSLLLAENSDIPRFGSLLSFRCLAKVASFPSSFLPVSIANTVFRSSIQACSVYLALTCNAHSFACAVSPSALITLPTRPTTFPHTPSSACAIRSANCWIPEPSLCSNRHRLSITSGFIIAILAFTWHWFSPYPA